MDKPPEFDKWRPWQFEYDEDGRRKRVLKDMATLPIVIELSREGTFRTRAWAWAWAQQGPTGKAQAADVWPPRFNGAMEAIGEYYHRIYAGYRAHDPEALLPEPSTMEQAKEQARVLSAANPFLIW